MRPASAAWLSNTRFSVPPCKAAVLRSRLYTSSSSETITPMAATSSATSTHSASVSFLIYPPSPARRASRRAVALPCLEDVQCQLNDLLQLVHPRRVCAGLRL